MGEPVRKTDHKFTYKDYATWPDEERWELIDGVAYNMSPAPTTNHQRISGYIFGILFTYLKEKSCEPFIAPFDVHYPRFTDQDFDSIDTVVQPDIAVICDSSKIIEKGCLGAPDMVVEVLSPSTSKKDLNEKFRLYEREGVREYWVVDPGNRYIQIFHLQIEGKASGKFDAGTLIPPVARGEKNTIAESKVIQGFQIDVVDLFKSLESN